MEGGSEQVSEGLSMNKSGLSAVVMSNWQSSSGYKEVLEESV
jgi:hypothetical protein